MPSGVVERIQNFNAGRDPKIVQRKYEKIAQDSFTFFRGTCHLFYEDWPSQTPLNEQGYFILKRDLRKSSPKAERRCA